MNLLKVIFLSLISASVVFAEQFTLFDETFTFEAKDAVQTQSHLYVKLPEQVAHWPKDWTYPVDYRNGAVHVRVEVLEKPWGDEPTHWSLCYIGRKAAIHGKPQYGCLSIPNYTKTGVYESTTSMNQFWNNKNIDWTHGIKEFHLVIKAKAQQGDNGMSHAHRRDHSKFFPTKVRIRLVQVSAGSLYDPNLADPKAEQSEQHAQQQHQPVQQQQPPYISSEPELRRFRPIYPK